MISVSIAAPTLLACSLLSRALCAAPNGNRAANGDATAAAKTRTENPEATDADEPDYRARRFEPAGFPLIAGNSDIGVELGVVGTLSRFGYDVVPYLWNMDLVLAASLKNGPNGLEIAQQSYQWNIDVPSALGGHARLNPQVSYYRTVNQLFFGIGNASSPARPANASPRYFEFDDRQARVRELTRVTFGAPIDVIIGTSYRYESPHIYSNSELEKDAARGTARAARPLSLLVLSSGIIYDSRDSEIFPHRGSFHDAGLRALVGFPSSADVRYGGAGLRLSTFVPLGGPAVLALRGVADLEFGHVPFYDLYTGGTFFTDEMIGGSSAVRGVPVGRYSGLIKAYVNAELRAMLIHVHWFGQDFHFGGDLLFDTGRLFSDYSFHAPEDGSGIGLKWGAGGGAYLQWGQAAVFRLEAAYSPDAVSENPSLPLGIYVEDGVMF